MAGHSSSCWQDVVCDTDQPFPCRVSTNSMAVRRASCGRLGVYNRVCVQLPHSSLSSRAGIVLSSGRRSILLVSPAGCSPYLITSGAYVLLICMQLEILLLNDAGCILCAQYLQKIRSLS